MLTPIICFYTFANCIDSLFTATGFNVNVILMCNAIILVILCKRYLLFTQSLMEYKYW